LKKKSSRRKTTRRVSKNHRIRLGFAVLFVLGFLILSLVGLSQFRQSYRPVYLDQYADITERLSTDEVRTEIESALIRNGIKIRGFKVKPQGTRIVFEIYSDFPDALWIDRLANRLKAISGDVRVHFNTEKRVLSVNRGKHVPFYLYFHPPIKFYPVPEKRPKVAIIMDDLGYDIQVAKELLKVGYPVTFSILPNVPQALSTAILAHEQGREVLIHIPMEPQSYPDADPGKNALLVNLSAPEIKHRFKSFLSKVPFAVGGNNHMGSRFTERKTAMETVLKEMKKEGLFFVDSLTTAKSIGYVTAKKIQIPVAVRDVFLDNVKDVDKISAQIVHLTDLAEKKGQAIGICHPYKQTIEALDKAREFFKERNIELVYVSRVLEN
jgi:polysaccharide deacetylase 2 family uncharacterized protein YibQ